MRTGRVGKERRARRRRLHTESALSVATVAARLLSAALKGVCTSSFPEISGSPRPPLPGEGRCRLNHPRPDYTGTDGASPPPHHHPEIEKKSYRMGIIDRIPAGMCCICKGVESLDSLKRLSPSCRVAQSSQLCPIHVIVFRGLLPTPVSLHPPRVFLAGSATHPFFLVALMRAWLRWAWLLRASKGQKVRFNPAKVCAQRELAYPLDATAEGGAAPPEPPSPRPRHRTLGVGHWGGIGTKGKKKKVPLVYRQVAAKNAQDSR